MAFQSFLLQLGDQILMEVPGLDSKLLTLRFTLKVYFPLFYD